MNFLSHYYFERHNQSSEEVLGTVLPDLVKNADKSWRIFPEKNEDLFSNSSELAYLFTGWKRHLEVDRYFHSSDFFKEHTQKLRIAVEPVLQNSPARPFFIAHIALELILDSLLLTENVIDTVDFYNHLGRSDKNMLRQFLNINKLPDTDLFLEFLNSFITSAYLNSYRESQHILYALNRICMRLWDQPFTKDQEIELTFILINYIEELKNDFMEIFERIEIQLYSNVHRRSTPL